LKMIPDANQPFSIDCSKRRLRYEQRACVHPPTPCHHLTR
jgi:hypothetical protein